ncbi:MAG: ATP-binding protein [Desulfoprunum sp.]|nr:ATP-binding protein [Desulfoprunum sp.]
MVADHLKTREELLAELSVVRVELREVSGQIEGMKRLGHGNDLQHLMNNFMSPIVITAMADRQVLYMNDCALRYFDVPMTEVADLNVLDYWLYPEDRTLFVAEITRKGRVRDFEAHFRTRDGRIKCALLSAHTVEFEGRTATVTIFADITERKLAEDALVESEARVLEIYNLMRLMTDTVPDLIWAKDLNDTYLFANKAICEKLLMSETTDESLGKNDLFFAERERRRGHRHTFGELCINSDEVVKITRQPGRFLEEGLVRGQPLVLDVFKIPLFDESGGLIGTVGAGRDITQDRENQKALRLSEERYRLLLENVRDVIWVMDKNLRFTFVTPSITTLSGYTPEEFLALPPHIHMTPRSQLMYETAVRRGLEREARGLRDESPRVWKFEWKCKDESVVWVETLTSILRAEDGSFQGIIGVSRDNTSRMRVLKDLKLAKEAALAANRAKSEFLANMSHEIRTPMNAVLGMLQLLRETPLNREQMDYANTALSSGESLLTLISEILDFSKIEAGKVELVEEPFALKPLVESVLHSFDSMVDRKRILFCFFCQDNVPECILADSARLRQILFNLLGNAVKFTEQGKISILLEARPGASEGKIRLVFEISDTGIGIPATVTDRLFEPFVQADGSFRRKYRGTGLGLSIVKRLVELMGGQVHLSSVEGQGTAVHFEIEVERAQACDIPDTSSPILQEMKNIALRVLVVEDEAINAQVVSAMLRNLGHGVIVAGNGRLALETLESERFDCIFMDIQMPEMDGIETALAIRQRAGCNRRDIPIIALTAHAIQGDRERFLAAGMNDYLTKPIKVGALKEILQNVAGQRYCRC